MSHVCFNVQQFDFAGHIVLTLKVSETHVFTLEEISVFMQEIIRGPLVRSFMQLRSISTKL